MICIKNSTKITNLKYWLLNFFKVFRKTFRNLVLFQSHFPALLRTDIQPSPLTIPYHTIPYRTVPCCFNKTWQNARNTSCIWLIDWLIHWSWRKRSVANHLEQSQVGGYNVVEVDLWVLPGNVHLRWLVDAARFTVNGRHVDDVAVSVDARTEPAAKQVDAHDAED